MKHLFEFHEGGFTDGEYNMVATFNYAPGGVLVSVDVEQRRAPAPTGQPAMFIFKSSSPATDFQNPGT